MEVQRKLEILSRRYSSGSERKTNEKYLEDSIWKRWTNDLFGTDENSDENNNVRDYVKRKPFVSRRLRKKDSKKLSLEESEILKFEGVIDQKLDLIRREINLVENLLKNWKKGIEVEKMKDLEKDEMEYILPGTIRYPRRMNDRWNDNYRTRGISNSMGNSTKDNGNAPRGNMDKSKGNWSIKRVQCYSCSELGHYVNNCPKRNMGNNGQRNNDNRRINVIDYGDCDGHEGSYNDSDDHDDYYDEGMIYNMDNQVVYDEREFYPVPTRIFERDRDKVMNDERNRRTNNPWNDQNNIRRPRRGISTKQLREIQEQRIMKNECNRCGEKVIIRKTA